MLNSPPDAEATREFIRVRMGITFDQPSEFDPPPSAGKNQARMADGDQGQELAMAEDQRQSLPGASKTRHPQRLLDMWFPNFDVLHVFTFPTCTPECWVSDGGSNLWRWLWRNTTVAWVGRSTTTAAWRKSWSKATS
jgi:hypothetical protein